jgi:hypothetical protein
MPSHTLRTCEFRFGGLAGLIENKERGDSASLRVYALGIARNQTGVHFEELG